MLIWLTLFLIGGVTGAGAIQLRLVGGKDEYEGRVEVRLSAQDVNGSSVRVPLRVWGTVCDDQWGRVDADVVCRQLGYKRVAHAYYAAHFGSGSGPILMDEVRCTGDENDLSECDFAGWNISNCHHGEDAGVRCYVPYAPRVRMPIRLVTDSEKRNRGRVEVKCGENWSAVDGRGFGAEEIRVACGQLGYPYGRRYRVKSCDLAWNRTVLMYKAFCTGKESILSECRAVEWGLEDCMGVHKTNGWRECELAHVQCAKRPFKKKSAKTVSPPPVTLLNVSAVRLVGGMGPYEGRLEVYVSGQWGTVCHKDAANQVVANVACRQAGYGTSIRNAWFGRGLGPIHLRGIECLGNESSLSQCRVLSKTNILLTECKHYMDSGVVCRRPENVLKTLRLNTSTRNTKYGFVEVQTNGTWHLVCDSDWSYDEARIVCRELELGYAEAAQRKPYEKEIERDYVHANYACLGHEFELSTCKERRVDRVTSQCATGAAWVSCLNVLPDLLPDPEVLRTSLYHYIQRINTAHLPCAMEENCFSPSAYNRTEATDRLLLRFTTRILNLGLSDFEPHATRQDWLWHECHRHYHSFEAFALYHIVNDEGVRQVSGHKASFCLEDSDCLERGPRPLTYFRCGRDHRGHQGISANCADTYHRNLDCQWVDVTDLPLGTYRLVVSVNPHRKVPEMRYDNNAVSCEFTYRSERHVIEVGDCEFV